MIERPHIQMPFSRGSNGKVVVVEQATAAHVSSQEVSVALCPIGFRAERPDFGWPIPVMRPAPLDPQPLVKALDELVPLPTPRDARGYIALVSDPSHWTIEIDSSVRE
jgi:hypothetical protein